MTAHHELLQVTVERDGSVTLTIGARQSFFSRCKQFLRRRFLCDVIADHRVETAEVGNLAKVDLLICSDALGKCALFENVEITNATL